MLTRFGQAGTVLQSHAGRVTDLRRLSVIIPRLTNRLAGGAGLPLQSFRVQSSAADRPQLTDRQTAGVMKPAALVASNGPTVTQQARAGKLTVTC